MTPSLKRRWTGLQQLSHQFQVTEIEELYRRAKDIPLSEEDFGLIRLWEDRSYGV